LHTNIQKQTYHYHYLVMQSQPFHIPKSIEQRSYQINIAQAALKENTLVVLPTGLGKTIIAILLIQHKRKNNPKEKILFLAPTKPLVLQHASFIEEHLGDTENITVFTGEVSPTKRKDLWHSSNIIISTPQVIENDLLSNRIRLDDVGLIVYDEAHHAIGKYAYVLIHEFYEQQRAHPYVLAMTASPGNELEKIQEVCANLGINHIEIRTKNDRDVKPFVHDLSISWKKIILPQEFSYPIQILKKLLSNRLQTLKDIGVLPSTSVAMITKTKLLEAQRLIRENIRANTHPPKELFSAASIQSEALKLHYALELLQTQGIESTRQFFRRMQQDAQLQSGTKSARNLIKDPDVIEFLAYLKTITVEHPKLDAVCEVVKKQVEQNADAKVIVFTHFRDTNMMVYERLSKIPKIKPVRFIGQASKSHDKGLSQKQQAEIVDQFRNGTYNVLIATSVAEEGLDIPSTDLVIFYEPIPSEIRNIQRRGRTARKMPGKLIILITKGTTDEGYYWASKRREKMMHRELELLRSDLQKEGPNITSKYDPSNSSKHQKDQTTLNEYSPSDDAPRIIVDIREHRSGVSHALKKNNVFIEPKHLDVADYIISSRIGVERKEVGDFLSSLIDGSLFSQLQRLRHAYSRPILIIEGEGLYTKRRMKQNAIFGAFVSIIVDYGVSILTAQNEQETALFLTMIAKREQKEHGKPIAIRGSKPEMNLSKRQQYIIESLPQISAVMAHRLLNHFGSIRALITATEEELQEVQGVGRQIAHDIYMVINEGYKIE